MCGGFVGDLLPDDLNYYERKKRQAGDAMAEADKKAKADADAARALKVSNNNTLQAELVASRRRRRAQSLLAEGGSADLAGAGRPQAAAVRTTATLGA